MAKTTALFKAPFYKTSIFWTRAIPFSFLFLFLINFWREITALLGGIWGWMWGAPRVEVFTHAFDLSVQVLTYNLLAFFGVFFIMALVLSAQALLPTQNAYETWNTFFHFLLHMLNWHGPAVFVKDGKVLATEEDWKRVGLGAIVVDFNSAVVLEEQVPPPSLLAPLYFILEHFLRFLWLYPPRKTPRSCRAGITFTRKRERIQGVVDLRKQSRARLNVGGYTRDGIEMKMLIFTIFTLGQDPDVLPVSYEGPRKKENLRALRWKRLPNGNIRVESLDEELDPDDKIEIQQFAQKVAAGSAMLPFSALKETYIQEWMHEAPIHLTPVFNEQRIFDAVYTQARSSQTLLSWDEMPLNVAENLLKEMLFKHNFDEIFHPETPQYPLHLLRNELRIRARNNGILSYSLVLHRSGKGLAPGEYAPSEIMVSPARPLTSPKALRERGIKVLAAGFNDLFPVSEQIYKQRLENWRVKWASEAEEAAAINELETTRILIQARKQGMAAMTGQLRRIFESDQNDETRALAILQALDAATNDPKMQSLLPQDTISLLRLISSMLTGEKPQSNLNPLIDPSATDLRDYR